MAIKVEIWDYPLGWKGFYMASHIGRIKSVARVRTGNMNGKIVRIPERLISIWKTKKGRYSAVSLYKNGIRTNDYVHRLVWSAFRGKIPDHLEINHIDGDKSNNRLSNLELVTSLQNQEHAKRLGLIQLGSKRPNSILTESIVKQIKIRIKNGESHQSIADDLEVARQTITNVNIGLTWAHVRI